MRARAVEELTFYSNVGAVSVTGRYDWAGGQERHRDPSSIPFCNYARMRKEGGSREGEGEGSRSSGERNEANHKFGHRLIDSVTSRTRTEVRVSGIH